jgi:two-component system response regulator EvgA
MSVPPPGHLQASTSVAVRPPATAPAKPASVVIVDDHPVLVSFLTEVLERQGRYRVVGRADTAATALELCTRLKPALVILDLGLLDSNDLSCLRALRAQVPRSPVLVFTGKLGGSIAGEMLQAGASGILGKTAKVQEIVEAVDRVAQGGMYLCAQACEAIRRLVRDGPPDRTRRPELSRQELTVLQHIASGLSNRQMAERMGLSRNTIASFRTRLARKTGRRSTAELVLYAARLGLVRVPGLRVATTNPTP